MSWQSLVNVNLNVVSPPGMCLAHAKDAVGAPAGVDTARESWDMAADKHWGDYNLPNVPVAVYWSWVGDVGYGVWDYGHVCIWVPGMGLFSSPKNWYDAPGSAWFYSIDEVSNWIGGSYLGWTSDINGMQIARWVEDGAPTPAPAPQPSWGGTYTVQPGDSLSVIADSYGITWQDLYAANAALIGPNPDYIEVGWVLTVPGATAPAPEPTPEPTVTPDATVDVTPTPEPQPEPTPEPETPMPETPALSQADRDKMLAVQANLAAKITPVDLGSIISDAKIRKIVWAVYGLIGLVIIGVMGGLTAAQWLAPEWFIFATGAYTAVGPAFAGLAVANIKS